MTNERFHTVIGQWSLVNGHWPLIIWNRSLVIDHFSFVIFGNVRAWTAGHDDKGIYG